MNIQLNENQKEADKSIELGTELKTLRDFSMELPFDLRGMAIGNCEKIKQVHNSFSRPESIYMMDMERDQIPSEDPFHFISLLPIGDHIYEFDGLEEGPIDHGTIDNNNNSDKSNDSWIKNALKIIQDKINLFGNMEIRFNLMALIEDRMVHLRRLADDQIRQACISKINPKIEDDIGKMIEEEQEKRDYYRRENKWRRINFIPVIMQLLEFMAKDGLLNSYI
jgi:ubiquitin carboxyl-terminal hydrolase L5